MASGMRINGLVERRREELGRVSEQQAKNGIVHGKSLISALAGFGQAVIEVSFPVVFTEEPVFTTGQALEANEYVVDIVPSITSIVLDWRKRVLTDDRTYWIGARIGVRVEGWEGMQFWLHYQFSGISLQNPVVGSGSMGETL